MGERNQSWAIGGLVFLLAVAAAHAAPSLYPSMAPRD